MKKTSYSIFAGLFIVLSGIFHQAIAGVPTTLYVGYPSAQSGSANPTNFAYSTPFFSAINNNGEAVSMYQIQLSLSTDASFASPFWDSGSGGVSITSTANSARCPDIFYAGSTLLSTGTNYIWRIRFYGSSGWGSWSTESATIGIRATPASTPELYSTSLFNDAALKAYYRLENLNDQKGSINLTNLNSVAFNAAKFNNGADFGSNNTNKGLYNNGSSPLTATQAKTAVTINAWIKLSTLNTAGVVALFEGYDGSKRIVITLEVTADNKVKFGMFPNNPGYGMQFATSTTSLALDTWYMVTGTNNGSQHEIFVNGVSEATQAWTYPGDYSLNPTPGTNIGSQYLGLAGPYNPLSGVIDDVAFFSKALSATEISNLYYNPGGLTARFYSGPVYGFVNNYTSTDWSTVRNASTGDVTTTAFMAGTEKWYWSTNVYSITRQFFTPNTSGLTSSAIISAASFNIYPSAYDGTPNPIGMVNHSITSTTTVAAGDYVNCGSLNSATEGTNARLSVTAPGAWYSMNLNATGISWISKTGLTKLGFRQSNDLDNSAPDNTRHYVPYWDTYNSANAPYLSVTYTIPTPPSVTTQAVSNIASTTATGNGTVTSEGSSSITERGVCWNTSTAPTTANSKAISSGTTGAFTSSMTGLTGGINYYVRAYAINSVGISYGNEVTFTTSCSNFTTVNWNNSNVQEVTLTACRSFTFANGKSGGAYSLIIKQDGTGGRVVTWPANIKWVDSSEPAIATSPNKINIIKFIFDGTNYLETGRSLNIW
ncbi:MAG: LamG domain-containing protein [Bacteroidetes bacterium]|nr:LamG domain-containing protein [Bacteroidota bacterium]